MHCVYVCNIRHSKCTVAHSTYIHHSESSLAHPPSSAVTAVCGDDEGESGGAPRSLPQAHWLRETAHVCRDRECALCLPASGAAVHVARDDKNIEYPGGPGDTASFLSSGQN